MKKLLLIFCATLSYGTFAQTDNSIPIAGNVGVGTLNPTHKLQVNGNVKVDSCFVVTDSMIMESNARIGEDLKIEGNLFLPSTPFPIEGEDKDFLIINTNGQVKKFGLTEMIDAMYSEDCIGLTDPNGTNTTYLAPVWHSEGFTNNTTGYLYTGNNCPAFVGIGTDTPTNSLDVRGRGYFSKNIGLGVQSDNAAQISAKTNREVGFCIDHNYSQNFGYAFKAIINSDQTKGIGIYSNLHNKDLFTVFGDGKMVVQNATGTTLQLEVSGLLRARHVKVDVDAWPDYVFEKDYTLMSLEEIKTYIQKEGHLPNVPSAEEIENNGMDIGEMNKILMEKVEELTLLMIEQQAQIKELQNKK